MRKIVLVLGMHRSATSLTTELLSSYGLFVGGVDDIFEPDENNRRGYFENKHAVRVNDKILYENGMHWAVIKETVNKLRDKKCISEINEVLSNMLSKAGDTQTLLLKDPRMCITEPVWKKQMKALGLEEHIVMVFRHPYEVAKSLEVRDYINFTYSLKLWFYNNFSALCSMAECDTPVLVLNHDSYFSSYREQINKIELFLNWTGKNHDVDKIIDDTLRHNNIKEIHVNVNSRLKDIVFELYQYLIGLSLMKQVVVKKEKINYFSGLLREIVNTSYLPNDYDMNPKVFWNSFGQEKKIWCLYQLENQMDLIVSGFGQLREEKFTELSVYGNGTLAEALFPVLEQAGITIIAVYDKNTNQKCGAAKQDIKVINIREAGKIEGNLLNTAVNYGTQIKHEFPEKFTMCRLLDLYDLLYNMLRDNLYS